MSLVATGPILFPYHYNITNDVSNSKILDATTDRVAVVFAIPKTGNLVSIMFSTRTVTTSQSIDMRLETVDATNGNPSGTLYHANATASVASPTSNTVYEPAFTAFAVTAGDMVAAVIQFTSTAGNLQIHAHNQFFNSVRIPYGVYNLTGSYAKDTSVAMNILLKYDDGLYYEVGVLPPLANLGSAVTVAYNSGSTTNERGIKFQVPAPVRVCGAWLNAYGATGGTYDVVLYDSDGSTVVTSVSFDGDIQAGSNGAGYIYVRFNTTKVLTINTYYRLTLKPTNTTNVTLTEYTFSSTAHMDAVSGGSNFHRTVKTSGSWVDTTTVRSWIGLVVDQFDNGAGGGGSSGPWGMIR